jgi:hypothetical protein
METTEHGREILEHEHAASDAIHILNQAADAAVLKIASAAEIANKVVSAAAAAAITESKTSEDHDLLVELRTKMEGLREDIKNLRNEQIVKINTHETRINDLETSNIRQTVCLAVGALWLMALSGMMVYHFFKIPM